MIVSACCRKSIHYVPHLGFLCSQCDKELEESDRVDIPDEQEHSPNDGNREKNTEGGKP